MIDLEKWQEIIKTLKQHKLRTTLTAFGVFWGIFMLSMLLGIGKGLENSVMRGFPEVKNSIFIWSGSPTQISYEGLPVGRRVVFKSEDVASIEKNVNSVAFVRGQNSVGIWGGSAPKIYYQGKTINASVEGTHAGMVKLNSMNITDGRSLNDLDDEKKRKVAILGQRVVEQLFVNGESAVGHNITINDISFLVIGVFESNFNGDKQREEEKIYLPNETLRQTFNQTDHIGSMVVLPKDGYSGEQVEKEVVAHLQKIKRVSPEDNGVIGSFNLQKEFDKVNGLFVGISMFSWIVAIGTIFAGVIGVGNIMLIVVKERTREIGLRKALGATPINIISMILQESLLITVLAGYSGLVVGVLVIEGVNKITADLPETPIYHPSVDFSTAITALVVLIIAGALASLLPALKAASVNPIVALQDE